MKKNLIKTQNLIIAFFLTLLGFGTACTKDNESPGIEYGTPHASFKVYGKITNESGSKIPAIRIVMEAEPNYFISDTVLSDYYGNYAVVVGGPRGLENFQLKLEDIDGAAHGSYQNKDVAVRFINPVFEGGEGSSKGEASQELNIQLEEK